MTTPEASSNQPVAQPDADSFAALATAASTALRPLVAEAIRSAQRHAALAAIVGAGRLGDAFDEVDRVRVRRCCTDREALDDVIRRIALGEWWPSLEPLDLAAERCRLTAFDARQETLRARWPEAAPPPLDPPMSVDLEASIAAGEAMLPAPAPDPMVVRRVHADGGSHIEPELDQRWCGRDQLRWKAAVVSAETGVPVQVTVHGSAVSIVAGHVSTGTGSCTDAWTLLSGIGIGAEAARGWDGAE